MAEHFTYFGTTPWEPQLASESEVGDRTEYPASMDIARIVKVYWQPKRYFIEARVSDALEVGGVPTMYTEGDDRAESVKELFKVGGLTSVVTASAEVNPPGSVSEPRLVTVDATLAVYPHSKFFEEKRQYLKLVLSIGGTTGFGSGTVPIFIASSSLPNGVFIGNADVLGTRVKMYRPDLPTHTRFSDVTFDVNMTRWDFTT